MRVSLRSCCLKSRIAMDATGTLVLVLRGRDVSRQIPAVGMTVAGQGCRRDSAVSSLPMFVLAGSRAAAGQPRASNSGAGDPGSTRPGRAWSP